MSVFFKLPQQKDLGVHLQLLTPERTGYDVDKFDVACGLPKSACKLYCGLWGVSIS
jgi:hypothetical protein